MPAGSLAPVARTVTFVPGAIAGIVGWLELGRPLSVAGAHAQAWHVAGLGAMLLSGLLLWPVVVVSFAVLGPAAAVGALVPRRVRGRYRQKHGRQGARSAYISKRLRRVTFAADRYRCVACHARRVKLEWDHIYPWIAGGRTTLWNGMTLCAVCNGIKLNYNQDRDGYEHYAGNRANIPQARAILRKERRHRYNLLRWTRAAWALAR